MAPRLPMEPFHAVASSSESEEDERKKRNRETQKNWYDKQRKIESNAKIELQRLQVLQVELRSQRGSLLQQAQRCATFLRERDCPFHTSPLAIDCDFSVQHVEERGDEEFPSNEETLTTSRSSTPSKETQKEKNRQKSRRFRLKVKLLTENARVLADAVSGLQSHIDDLSATVAKLESLANQCEISCDSEHLSRLNKEFR